MRADPLPGDFQIYLEAVESELQRAIKRANDFGNSRLYEMLAYHMGWENHPDGIEVRGKRFRPLLVLLTCSAAGGDWHQALPAASAVELVHNFSLIHDDIEDHSPLRRGRPTIWKKWGIPQAINAGDAMFALAHLEAIRLSQTVSLPIAIKAVDLLQYTCLQLTEGQFLDLSYESRDDISIDDYWRMVKGKTAALIAASTELGAMAAEGDHQTCELYQHFGYSLGLAFQARDDWLGIWGNTSLTGKSSQSDLVTGKITLPVLYGLSQSDSFASRWKKGSIAMQEVTAMTKLLEDEGGKDFTEAQSRKHVDEALAVLEQAHPQEPFGDNLRNLALSVVNRQV
jgi:geranylgeranyl diphosphate synthase type I